MKRKSKLLAGLVGILSSTLLASSASAESVDLSAKWKDGLRFESANNAVTIKVGGRIMNDWTFNLSADDALEAAVGELEDGTEFRRARLFIAGDLYKKLEFKAEYDFAGSDADFKDVYLKFKDVPVVHNVQVGHFKEAFGLEELTSSKYITFMERSLTSAFVPSRNTGISIQRNCPMTGAGINIGAYRDTGDDGDGQGDDDAYNYTARIFGAPVHSEDSLLHLGFAFSHSRPEDDTARFRARPEIHQGPRYVDTGDISAEDLNLYGIELAGVMGSFSLQGEYMFAAINDAASSDPDLSAFYVMASTFLTGESRPYKASNGTFDRVKPNSDFVAKEPGSGAWELAARYSQADLNDQAVAGGELQDYTVGLNWYLHPNARIMVNWVYADLDNVGDSHSLLTRFQADF